MNITDLTDNFDVTQYQLASKSATVALEGGTITARAQYKFRNSAGQQRGAVVMIQMVITQSQSDDLKAILADVLQATNAEIESQIGWTEWIPPEND